MQIFVPKEAAPEETRVALIPADVKRLVQLGAQVEIETGIGATLGIADSKYIEMGATVGEDRHVSFGKAEIVLRLRKPPIQEVKRVRAGALHVSYLDPFNEKELVNAFAQAKVSAVSMEMIPRTTLAQKMDALSSQANLAGYVSVILAAERLNKILPMMMTPSGTIKPSRVFVIGVGVAGLQAIATAKRLGARVDAFDTRPVVEEQVRSLGAKFVKVDLGETGQTQEGYAKALTEEQLLRQRDAMARVCAQSDIVITTAQLFGRKAPVIVTKEMVNGMAPGSVVVDLAVESGGNVEGAELGKEIEINGVKIIGLANLPGLVPVAASQMYSANLTNFVEHFWKKETKRFALNLEDEILKGCLLTHGGQIVNARLKGTGK